MKKYKVYLDSAQWTCYSNFTTLSRIYKYLDKNNHIITHDLSEADYIIINSCGHTERSEKTTINNYKKIKDKKKPDAKIIITGCLVKINQKKLKDLNADLIELNNLNQIDSIFYKKIKFEDTTESCDPATKNKIMHKKNLTSYDQHYMFQFPLATFISNKIKKNIKYFIDLANANNVVFIRVGQGCTGNCSYCAIKKAKGKPQSREPNKIINDIKKYYNHSKTFYLVADDCGSYGVDKKTNLPDLLYLIKRFFPDIKIHLEFLEPIWIKKNPEEYIKVFKEVNIEFAVVPLQSGSNKIVKKMNRRYDVKEIVKTIQDIRKISPNTIFSTYFIIGFPGETFIDFLKSINFAKYFDFVFLMPFSEREGTTCVNFDNKKSNFVIMFRYSIATLIIKLFTLIKAIRFDYTKKR